MSKKEQLIQEAFADCEREIEQAKGKLYEKVKVIVLKNGEE